MEMETELKKTFADLEYFSTTADLWTAQNKSFLGITVHWINPVTLHRQKAAIACRRFRGRHTYDAIAAEIEQIHSSFALCDKITATVTDNGPNFVKAFRMFQADDEADNDVDKDKVIFTELHEVLRDDSERVKDMTLVDLNQLCTRLDIRCITEREYQFLKEYCKVLKPVCEDDCFYGTLQPTLEILMAKILALKDGLSPMMANLPDLIVQAIKTWFSSILDSDEALLAAVTLPKFKLRWLRDEKRKDNIKIILAAQCRALTIEIPQKEPLQSPESKDHENDFFAFAEEENTHDEQAITVDMEICEYLKSADMGNFPSIFKIFLKANTATPSSALVERLFSIGSLILTPKRNRLTDQRFEKLLLLRYNRYFENKT
ncbi:hypothetical protein DPX16_23606 [Anabarilius grahami]|uniref:HAT C-terminal dimerisation domain-containing protein n=1 Tax=Anabarilius grahami TaxID=495550 RepID=A0A3N0ZAY3_ANAGA|nr:hypothetical protein DPX16_23606 [Anabarilius grahami]